MSYSEFQLQSYSGKNYEYFLLTAPSTVTLRMLIGIAKYGDTNYAILNFNSFNSSPKYLLPEFEGESERERESEKERVWINDETDRNR